MPLDVVTPGAPLPDIATPLIEWQRCHGRHDLPWQVRDAYRVWLSEVMLQQTQVATVKGYFIRFIERFPDVAALAAAPLDDVLALWSGLGYYSRARNLWRCARVVVEQHGGRFPDGAAVLETLPGIGRSTAAAIAAFCQGERVAILDGNVRRVLTRVLAFDEDPMQPAAQRRLWAMAEALLPEKGIEPYTQGLMDLGATVCLPRNPRCGGCPLRSDCRAAASADPSSWPKRRPRAARRRADSILVWLWKDGQVWLQRRPDRGVWAGLWCLPAFADLAAVQAAFAGSEPAWRVLPARLHVLTHRDWWLQPWVADWPPENPAAQTPDDPPIPGRWWTVEQALQQGLPAPVREWLCLLYTSPSPRD